MAREGRKTAARRPTPARRSAWITGGALAALAVVVLVVLAVRPPETPELSVGGDPTLGRDDAPVKVFYFSDFQCPYCRQFELGGNMDALKREYFDSGRAQLVFKDFPIIGPDSYTAAQASEYVWENHPDAYWQWHRRMFEEQRGENAGWATPDEVVRISSAFPAIDADRLGETLRGTAYRGEINADKEDGTDRGVRGTPTLVIGGEVVNALDLDAVRAAIEGALRDRSASGGNATGG